MMSKRFASKAKKKFFSLTPDSSFEELTEMLNWWLQYPVTRMGSSKLSFTLSCGEIRKLKKQWDEESSMKEALTSINGILVKLKILRILKS